MKRNFALFITLSIAISCTPRPDLPPEVIDGAVRSADGVSIGFTAAGSADLAIVFVHCGFCDRSFWSDQLQALSDRYRVVSLDLAGHGSSGAAREEWTLRGFGEDVRAVVEALDLNEVVLVGNSLGGPVSLEAAALMPQRVLGIVAVDTLQDADVEWNEQAWRERIETFRTDYAEACSQMIGALLHPGSEAELVDFVHDKMCSADGEFAAEVLGMFLDYDLAAAMRAVRAPIRAINGDLYPTNIEGNRKHAPGFDAVVMEGVGHFPQLERPEEFNQELLMLVALMQDLRN